jgi:hypothetical protein
MQSSENTETSEMGGNVQKRGQPQRKAPDDRIAQLKEDITRMYRFCMERSVPLPGRLYESMDESGLIGAKWGDRRSADDQSWTSIETDRASDLTLVHTTLQRAIAPATLASLRETEPRWGGLLVSNAAIRFLAIAGITSLLSMIVLLALDVSLPPANAVEIAQPPADPSTRLAQVSGELREFALVLASASLGSVLFSLGLARKYITERTFDPMYNQVYFVRYIMGVVSGFILGSFADEIVGGEIAVSSALLAVVGGYAADAVGDILRRFAEIVGTAVRGADESRTERVRAEERVLRAEERAELITALQRMNSEAREAGASQEIVELLDSLTSQLLDLAPDPRARSEQPPKP